MSRGPALGGDINLLVFLWNLSTKIAFFLSLRGGWCGNNIILRTPPATFYLLLRLDVVLEILFALSIESKSEKKTFSFA